MCGVYIYIYIYIYIQRMKNEFIQKKTAWKTIYAHTHTHTHIYIYINIHTHTHAHIYVYISFFKYNEWKMNMHWRNNLYIYIYIYIYSNKHVGLLRVYTLPFGILRTKILISKFFIQRYTLWYDYGTWSSHVGGPWNCSQEFWISSCWVAKQLTEGDMIWILVQLHWFIHNLNKQ